MTIAEGGSPEIRQLARYQVRPDGIARCIRAIHEYVEHVRANEPGTTSYQVWQEQNDPTRFVHIFTFRDADAELVHAQSPANRKFVDALAPECLARIEFIDYREIDAS